jgi:PadR family transcriptional regulator, regulatory protein AphA
MELSPTAYVILGMVSVHPRSGYEIKAAVDESTRRFWAASYGQIYPELKRLSEAGLVSGVDSPRGERRRTVYTITDAGLERLKEWLRLPPETAEMRDEGLLKLFFSGVLEPTEAAETLRRMGERRTAIADDLAAIEPRVVEKSDEYALMVLRAGIEYNRWFADWCARMQADLLSPAEKERSA